MSSRTDRIRNMFTAPQADALSADNNSGNPPRVAAGSVRALKDTFSQVERENDELRGLIGSGATIFEIDPNLVDASPISDRFSDPDDRTFEALKSSIAQRGQDAPILVRPHPAQAGRYQCAFGHRRLRAMRDLGQRVKAVVRTMTDEELVVAQGVENSAREDLSFIERAVFAMKLEDSGHNRALIQTALTIDRAEASKLISVARSVPQEVVRAIGRAPQVGRGRWLALAGHLQNEPAKLRVMALVMSKELKGLDTDARFGLIFNASARGDDAPSVDSNCIKDAEGRTIVRIKATAKDLRVSIDTTAHDGFADFVVQQLPGLFSDWFEKEKQARLQA